MARIIPPRLHVILARGASSAVVIRRGPTRHAAVTGWDRATDRFTTGQWMYGRIYERRCDLSPDGRYLIYFAMNGRWSAAMRGSWTAISRAPYLKALALYPKGDCWHGGGLFQSNTAFWLNGCHHAEAIHANAPDAHRLGRVDGHPWHEHYGGECPSVYYIRLQRDGWTMKHTAPDGAGGHVTVFEKRLSHHWILRKHAHATIHKMAGRGVYFDTHELVNARTAASIAKDGWEWADLDGERLVWTAGGCVLAGRLTADGVHDERVLHDARPLAFEKLEAPY